MNFDKKMLKKILIVITIAILLFTIYKIVTTYSLLQSQMNGTVEQSIAKWNIELNKVDITNGISKQIEIKDFSFVQDSNVKEGKIAPGVCGMIDLTIDPKDTDVSVIYDITLGDIADQPISIESIEIISGTSDLVKTGENTYTGIMSLSNINNNTAKTTIRITVLWANDDNNNENDTKIGTQSGYTLDVPIEFSARQYLGETITEY